MAEVEVVVSHRERATLRVGDVFLKVDSDPDRLDREARAMAIAPIPTAPILWAKPSVLALASLTGVPLGRLGASSTASPAAWAAAGAALRVLHQAPLPAWPGGRHEESVEHLDRECDELVASGILPADLVDRNRAVAQAVFRSWEPTFTHGDLQVSHVFVQDDFVTGVLDWSEAGQGDPMYDVALLTLGHEDRLVDVVAGYAADVDLDVIRGYWSKRSLLSIRWLAAHGFDPFVPGAEVDVLRARM